MFLGGTCRSGALMQRSVGEVCWDGTKGVLSGRGDRFERVSLSGACVYMLSSPYSSGAGPGVCIVGCIHARTPPLAQRGKPLPP